MTLSDFLQSYKIPFSTFEDDRFDTVVILHCQNLPYDWHTPDIGKMLRRIGAIELFGMVVIPRIQPEDLMILEMTGRRCFSATITDPFYRNAMMRGLIRADRWWIVNYVVDFIEEPEIRYARLAMMSYSAGVVGVVEVARYLL